MANGSDECENLFLNFSSFGKATVKTDPFPGSLLTTTRPP